MPMDNNTNKLINNGYLRTPYITKNNGHGTNSNSNATVTGVTSKRTNNVDAGGGGVGVGVGGNVKSTEDGNDSDAAAPTVISPLLGVENKSELSATEVMHHSSPQQQQQQHQHQHQHQQRPLLPCANNVGHTLKHPTVVYLDADSGKTIPSSGVVNTTLQHNVPVAYSPQTSSHHHHQSEWLIKESTLRCRLLVLAVALTVLGAAIGALAIYFAGGNYRCQTATHTIDKSRNINNNISTTGLTYDRDDICLSEECRLTYYPPWITKTANPCENFFQYACGTWNKVHIIPEDRSSISTFEVLADQQQVILKGVLEEPINDEDNQATIKAKMFYKSCIDIPQIRKVGEGRLKNVLKSLGGWPVIEPEWFVPNMTVEELIGILRGTYGEPVLIELYVGADDKNSSIHVLQIDQFPLALPSRDYYLKSSSEQDLKAYHRYMTQTAILMGANPVTAAQELNDVLQLEVKLVNATLPEADRHDTSAIYRKINLRELQTEVPQINWTLFLQTALGKDIELKEDEELVSYAMPYLVDMGKILKETDRRVLHNYVLWRLVMSIMTHMIDDYQKER
ncbi:hypothetical protein DOY81_010034, partial [Sarcophaga bullata]